LLLHVASLMTSEVPQKEFDLGKDGIKIILNLYPTAIRVSSNSYLNDYINMTIIILNNNFIY